MAASVTAGVSREDPRSYRYGGHLAHGAAIARDITPHDDQRDDTQRDRREERGEERGAKRVGCIDDQRQRIDGEEHADVRDREQHEASHPERQQHEERQQPERVLRGIQPRTQKERHRREPESDDRIVRGASARQHERQVCEGGRSVREDEHGEVPVDADRERRRGWQHRQYRLQLRDDRRTHARALPAIVPSDVSSAD